MIWGGFINFFIKMNNVVMMPGAFSAFLSQVSALPFIPVNGDI